MEPVEDETGRRYLLQKRASGAWLVLDPETGEESYRDPDELERVADEAPLAVAAAGVPDHVRRLVLAAGSERALGLATTVVDRGPIGVRTLLAETALCESDLHGLLAELVAAGLIEEAEVAGERGYAATDDGAAAVERLRGAATDDGLDA